MTDLLTPSGIGRRPWTAGLLAALLAPAACSQGAYTRIKEIWRTDQKIAVKRVLVMAAWDDIEKRRLVEGRIADAFLNAHVPAFSAQPLVDAPYPYPRPMLITATEQQKLDGAMIVRMIAFDHSASVDVTGPPVGDDPRAQWSSALRHVYQSEGESSPKTARAETLVYEVGSEKLLWSGLSETFEPVDLMDGLASYGKAITTALLDSGIVVAS